ncbi:unnamed protein product, partial [marine sediment metagenome]
ADYSSEGTFSKTERNILLKAMTAQGAKILRISRNKQSRKMEAVIVEAGKKSEKQLDEAQENKIISQFTKVRKLIFSYSEKKIRVPSSLYMILRLPEKLGANKFKITEDGKIEVNGEKTRGSRTGNTSILSASAFKDLTTLCTVLAHETNIPQDIQAGLSEEDQHMEGMVRERIILERLHKDRKIDEDIFNRETKRLDEAFEDAAVEMMSADKDEPDEELVAVEEGKGGEEPFKLASEDKIWTPEQKDKPAAEVPQEKPE